ncbi:hypothetical protein WMF37_18610 [Sorangium sp. So ce291]|uniref:hypothetical protein n=1 Tax=Sorangium sp. So ce291 TaxID=3133294 RepID=UPI003F63F2DC
MAFNEIAKAIQWSNKTTSGDGEIYPVEAYFVLHAGSTSTEPVNYIRRDAVWYAHGTVQAVATPTPHLEGTLGTVYTASIQSRDPALSSGLSVRVQIFPDGQLSVQKLLHGTPIGGMPPTQLQTTDVRDNLMVAINGIEVWTLGVALLPHYPKPPQ